MDHDSKKAPELRQVIAATVSSDTVKYSEVFLGKTNEEYCAWILDSEKWGGTRNFNFLHQERKEGSNNLNMKARWETKKLNWLLFQYMASSL